MKLTATPLLDPNPPKPRVNPLNPHVPTQVWTVRAINWAFGVNPNNPQQAEEVVFEHAFSSRVQAQEFCSTQQAKFPMFVWDCRIVPLDDADYAALRAERLQELAAEVNRADELWLKAAIDYATEA